MFMYHHKNVGQNFNVKIVNKSFKNVATGINQICTVKKLGAD